MRLWESEMALVGYDDVLLSFIDFGEDNMDKNFNFFREDPPTISFRHGGPDQHALSLSPAYQFLFRTFKSVMRFSSSIWYSLLG